MQVFSPRRSRRGFRPGWLIVLALLRGSGVAIVRATADDTAATTPLETMAAVEAAVGTLTVVAPPVSDDSSATARAVTVVPTAVDGTLTINLIGDVQPAEVPEALLGDDPPYGFDRVVALVRDADLTFANFECPVATGGSRHPSKPYAFRATPDRLTFLRRLGIDAVTLGNNHVGDFGPAAFAETLRHFAAAGIPYTGAGLTRAEALRPVLLARNGVTVAFLAFNDVVPAEVAPYVNRPTPELLQRSSAAARAEHGADIVIVSLHMGIERQELTERQTSAARAAIDAGADIVHGHHPHCILGFERRGRGLIAYSMGNFLFGHSGRSFRDTGLLRVTIRDKRVAEAQIIPLRDKDGPGNCYIPLLPDDTTRARIIGMLDGYSRRTGTRVAADGGIHALE